MKEKGSSFSGSIGFVLAAAGSAVGVGNIWRFPYLCAKDGGGLFLLVYLVLVLTFGFVLLTTDVAIGRKTKKNALRAFEALNPKWKFLGKLTFIVPTLIMTYYSVIGGWITKYFVTYIISDGKDAAADGYFTAFITSDIAPIVFMLVFLALTAWIVYRGVEKGIEKFFQDHHARTDSSDPDHRDFLTDTDTYRCRRNCPYRYGGTCFLCKARFQWAHCEAFPGNSSGCNEPALFLLKRFHGNHGSPTVLM